MPPLAGGSMVVKTATTGLAGRARVFLARMDHSNQELATRLVEDHLRHLPWCRKAKKTLVELSTVHEGKLPPENQLKTACSTNSGVEPKDLIKRTGTYVCSSNYALYGDLSNRVATILRQESPGIEVYSIDEAFADVTGIADVREWALRVRSRILQGVGIPVCIGVAQTKTLAKVANRVAKKFKERTAGVHLLESSDLIEKALRWLPIEDVWGIGLATSRKLKGYGIRNAWDFTRRSEPWVRKTFGVVLTRTWLELNGKPCADLVEVEAQRKTLRTSRSFEKCLTKQCAIEEAIATFASRTAAKLRERELCASALSVFLVTNRFD